MKAVNAGEIDGALIYHYYYFGDQAKTGENTNNVAPHYFRNQDPGAFVSISGGGVLTSSKHKEAAQAFLKWITGKAGQDDPRRRAPPSNTPSASGAASNQKLVPLTKLQARHRRSGHARQQEGHRADDPGRPAVTASDCRHRSDPASSPPRRHARRRGLPGQRPPPASRHRRASVLAVLVALFALLPLGFVIIVTPSQSAGTPPRP